MASLRTNIDKDLKGEFHEKYAKQREDQPVAEDETASSWFKSWLTSHTIILTDPRRIQEPTNARGVIIPGPTRAAFSSLRRQRKGNA